MKEIPIQAEEIPIIIQNTRKKPDAKGQGHSGCSIM